MDSSDLPIDAQGAGPVLAANTQAPAAPDPVSEDGRQIPALHAHLLLQAIEQSPVSVVITTVEDVIEYVNATFCAVAGYTREEVLGRNARFLQSEPTLQATVEERSHVVDTGRTWRGAVANRKKSGEVYWTQASIAPLRNDQGEITHLVAVENDFPAHLTVEETARRADRALAATLTCNQAVVRAGTEGDLLAHVAQAIVDAGRYPLAWIGYKRDDAASTVEPVAWAGPEASYLQAITVTWGNDATGRGAVGQAIRTGKPHAMCDILTDPAFEPWRAAAAAHHIGSAMAIPLCAGTEVIGALVIYAREPDAFAGEELGLLARLADDLSFGIVSQRAKLEHERAVEALRVSEARFRAGFEQSTVGMARVGFDGMLLEVNDRMCDILGYSRADLLSMRSRDFTHPEDLARSLRFLDQVNEGAAGGLQQRYIRKDGSVVWGDATSTVIRGADGRALYRISALQDVTARKRAEEEAQVAAALLRENFDSAALGMAVIGLDGRYLQVNPALCRMLGYSVEGLLGLRLPEITHPDDREGSARNLDALLGGSSASYHAEKRYLHKDGHTVWAEVHGTLVRDAEGRPLHIVNQTQDITARKQVQGALRESEQRYRRIVDTASEGIVQTTADGIIAAINPALAQMVGSTVDELMGRDVLDLMVEQEHEKMRERGATRRAGDYAPRRYSMRLRHRDGRDVWTQVSGNVVFDDTGRYAGILALVTDVTAQRQAEVALRVSEARYRRIVETAQEAIMELDLSSNITYINKHGATLLGYSPEELRGRASRDVVDQEWHAILDATAAWRQVNGEELEPSTLKLKHRSGVAVWVWISGNALYDDANRLVGRVRMFTDITARKQAEDALRASEARYRAQFQALPVPTYTWQRQGETWVLTDFNQAADRLAQGRAHRFLGRSAADLYGHQPEMLDDMERSWRTGAIVEHEMTYRTVATDEVREFIFSYSPIPPDVILLHSIDVTERTGALEQVRRHVARLSALRRIDTAIASSVDLQSTLQVVLSQVCAELAVDAAQVLLLNRYTLLLESAAGLGFRTPTVAQLTLRLGQGHAGRAAKERRRITATDLTKEEVVRAPLVADERFVAYVALPLIAKGEVHGVLEIFHRAPLTLEPEWVEFLEALAGQTAIAIDNARLLGDLQRSNDDLLLAYEATIEGWARALDLRDKETEGHSRRVTEMTMRLAQAGGMRDADLIHVRRGALLHDIGKMGVPDAILLKQGPLTDEEWVIMRRHPTLAYTMLAPIAHLGPALDIPYCHHEKWDGSGYPRGLVGEQIPLAARIFAVVDVYDALTSERPYRAAWSVDKTREHIRGLAGSHFDPAAVATFLTVLTH